MTIQTVTDAIRYVGVDDNTLALFENQYPVQPMGVSYNSYVILDEKIAVMDSVDARAAEEWLSNVAQVLEGRNPDYLVVTHMEPDHSGSLMRLAQKYPEMKIVGNAKTFTMIKQFFGTGALSEDRMLEVGEGSTISLGSHRLRFLLAPMVHWPEVMAAYEETEKILFSADAFGRFGSLERTARAPWAPQARRYYYNIVGKYGAQVQALLKKISALEIKTICPLHGPVLTEGLEKYLRLYDLWSQSAGGQMALTEQIDNYPGFEDGIDGFSLAEKMQKQAERFGARSEYAEVLRMDLTAVPKLVETSEGIFLGKTVVLATGADPRTLGVARESELVGRGVAYCAACDGMFYKGKTVVVVGGGNSAAADALLLSRVAKKVILVHRRDTLRATKIYHEPLAQAENVEFRWNSVVSALLSGDRLTGVRLRDTVTGEESVVDCDGVFVSVGRQPATALAVGQLALDGGGYIVAGETTETSIPGVYAVGDVRTKPLRQVVTAVADGAMAVHMAEKYIAENR